MPLTLVELAHYGRYYSYTKRKMPLWWYDREGEKVVSWDEMAERTGIGDEEADLDWLRGNGFVPLFQCDVLALEKRYAHDAFDARDCRTLGNMDGEEFDYAFMKTADRKGLLSDWYQYELEALKKEALIWLKENHIRLNGK